MNVSITSATTSMISLLNLVNLLLCVCVCVCAKMWYYRLYNDGELIGDDLAHLKESLLMNITIPSPLLSSFYQFGYQCVSEWMNVSVLVNSIMWFVCVYDWSMEIHFILFFIFVFHSFIHLFSGSNNSSSFFSQKNENIKH